MKCPECQERDVSSKVYSDGRSKTLLGWSPFYDEDGRPHTHDPNVVTEGFHCSHGHVFAVRYRERCMSCDFGGKC